MKEFITYLIQNLVDQPEAVDIQLIENEKGTIVEVRAFSGDVAKIIGRQGRTINALRTIAMIVGARFGRRVRIELIQ